jgi:hypothetical protein
MQRILEGNLTNASPQLSKNALMPNDSVGCSDIAMIMMILFMEGMNIKESDNLCLNIGIIYGTIIRFR